MQVEKYKELIKQLSQTNSLKDDAPYDVCNVVVRGISFSIVQGNAGDEDSLYIYGEVGSPSVETKVNVLERLMGMNLWLYGSNNNVPAFGFDVEKNQVLIMYRMAISDTKFESLQYVLNQFAKYIDDLRPMLFVKGSGNYSMPLSPLPDVMNALN